eukprot:762181-Hanusia_phi.AAC.9
MGVARKRSRALAVEEEKQEKGRRGRKGVKKPKDEVEEVKEEEVGEINYEERRKLNIARNQEILSSLMIQKEHSALQVLKTQEGPRRFEKKQRSAPGESLPLRRSTRGKPQEGSSSSEHKAAEPPAETTEPKSVEEIDIRQVDNCLAASVTSDDLAAFHERVRHGGDVRRVSHSDGRSHHKRLKSLALSGEEAVSPLHPPARVKVVKERIFSLAFHPGEKALVVAGDKWGQIGFLDVGSDTAASSWSERVFVFRPHIRPVSSLLHSADGTRMWSCSYDGTVRCLNYDRGSFVCVFDSDVLLTDLSMSCDQKTMLCSTSDGDLFLLDPSGCKSKEPLSVLDVHERKVSSVHFHPSDPHLFVTASNDQTVRLWDQRKIVRSKPLSSLGHTLGVTSAFFSPCGSGKVVTTCNDNYIRIWDTKRGDQVVKVKHNNETGRYITNFRALWDPKSSDTIVVGSMNKNLDIIAADGAYVASISDERCTAIPAVNAVHPSLDLIASGNGSGYVNIWHC